MVFIIKSRKQWSIKLKKSNYKHTLIISLYRKTIHRRLVVYSEHFNFPLVNKLLFVYFCVVFLKQWHMDLDLRKLIHLLSFWFTVQTCLIYRLIINLQYKRFFNISIKNGESLKENRAIDFPEMKISRLALRHFSMLKNVCCLIVRIWANLCGTATMEKEIGNYINDSCRGTNNSKLRMSFHNGDHIFL